MLTALNIYIILSMEVNMQVELSLTLPDNVQVDPDDVKTITVYAMFERGILSSGQAAEILGLSKRTFLENASLHGVSLFQYDENELKEEIEQWR
jgi:predicted HTH domain antitoxin